MGNRARMGSRARWVMVMVQPVPAAMVVTAAPVDPAAKVVTVEKVETAVPDPKP
jgi:hypothetical protein